MNLRLLRTLARQLAEGAVTRYLADNPGTATGHKQPRRLFDIYTDIGNLTAGQQSAIWTNLDAGNPPLWATDDGDNAAAIMVLHWAVANSGASTANVNNAKRRLAALYVQDNPTYLVLPTFDPAVSGVNIPGDEVA